MKMPSARAQKYVQTRYFLRYLITGVVIYVAIINPWVNIIGVLLGLVAVKISVLINTTVSKKNVLINEA
jgi:F0F1-type ATP synthase assembly protein I